MVQIFHSASGMRRCVGQDQCLSDRRIIFTARRILNFTHTYKVHNKYLNMWLGRQTYEHFPWVLGIKYVLWHYDKRNYYEFFIIALKGYLFARAFTYGYVCAVD